MSDNLSGSAMLFDSANSVVLSGNLSLISDGVSRSEIVIANAKTGETERLVFTIGKTWVPVYHLIQVIRELYQSNELEIIVTGPDSPCPECGGARMIEDDEGN